MFLLKRLPSTHKKGGIQKLLVVVRTHKFIDVETITILFFCERNCNNIRSLFLIFFEGE